MLPVVSGDKSTLNQILIYSWILVASSFAVFVSYKISIVYGVIAIILGGIFLIKSYQAKIEMTESRYRSLFGYSILYLMILFTVIIIDGII